MDEHGQKLRKYLLGSLPESEATELDLQLIASDELAGDLAHAEQELVEDHLDRLLTVDEEELFQQNFLVSDERRQMLHETSLLREYADKFTAPTNTVSEPATSLIEKLRSLFARPAFAGAAVVVALLVAGLVWQVFLRDTSTPLEREYAVLNQRDLSNTNDLAFSSISLASANLRDSNSGTRQNVANLTDTVLVRLALPPGEDAGTFKATVLKGLTKTFAIGTVKSYQNPNGREVRMLLPKASLESGQYQIRLERPGVVSPLTYSLIME